MDDEIYIGDEVKALGDGRVGGYLVRYTAPGDTDAVGDYFDADTELRHPDKLDVLYHHGMDTKIGKRVIGAATVKADEIGQWVEAQLNMRDEYEKAIYDMAKAGKLGWSSGAISHLVEREPVGKSQHIKLWAIGEASLTPTPAEYRNAATTLKSLSTPPALADEDITPHKAGIDMNEIETAVKAALDVERAAQKAEADRLAALAAAEQAGYQKALTEVKAGPVVNTITSPHDSDDVAQMKSFRHWMKTGQVNSDLLQPTADMKAAMAIGAGGTGGYLVPDPLYNQIVEKRNLASWVRMAPTQKFSTPADHLLVPVEDTSMTAFVSTAEAGAYNENEPTFAQVDLVNGKYTKLIKASEEFINYEGTNFDGWLATALGRAEAVTENTAATTVLIAAATASGITTAAAAAITIPELASVAGVLGAGYNVPGEAGWLMANATKFYLQGVFGTNYYAFDGFFNRPAFISDDLPAVAATNKAVYFGNFNYFGVVERPGMVVQRNPWLYMANGQVGIFATIFRGFGVLQAEAFYSLLQHA